MSGGAKHTPEMSESEREMHLCGPEDGCRSCDEVRRIIAAAPDLLEAAKLAIEELKESGVDGQSHEGMISILEKAISKAEARP